LNPKTYITNVHVIDKDIVKVFGESQVLKTTTSDLDPNTRLELLCLYLQCCGITNVTNHEFYLGLSKVTLPRRKV